MVVASIVRNQRPVDHVVARLGPIDPLALTHRPIVTHAHVLRQLLPEELSERSEDVVEHPARCRRQVQILRDGVQRDAVHAEHVRQQDQVAEIPRQPVESPDQQMRYVPGLDGREDLLETRPVHVLAGHPGSLMTVTSPRSRATE